MSLKLADSINWSEIERTFGAHFVSGTGRPALRPRLVAGLLYLQHAYDCVFHGIVNSISPKRDRGFTKA